MRLEEGKYYYNRMGDLKGPITIRKSGPGLQYLADIDGRRKKGDKWTLNGFAYIVHERRARLQGWKPRDPDDLVREAPPPWLLRSDFRLFQVDTSDYLYC